jgi:hypothetical protein
MTYDSEIHALSKVTSEEHAHREMMPVCDAKAPGSGKDALSHLLATVDSMEWDRRGCRSDRAFVASLSNEVRDLVNTLNTPDSDIPF